MQNKYIRDFIFSIALFFLLVISVNIFLFPEFPGFLGLNPHPYLVVILLISGRFGLKEGMISALIAIIILSIYVYIETRPYFSLNIFFERDFIITLVSYCLSGLIVGEMRRFNKSYEGRLLRENNDLKGEKFHLNEQLEIVNQIKEELEDRIVGQEETVHSLYQATKSLETLEEEQFYKSLTQITARFTGASKISLYFIDYSKDSLRQVARFGWDDGATNNKSFPLYEGMFAIILKNNNILTIKEISDNPEHLQIWENCPYKAYAYVPISMASVPVGILTVDEIPFLKLNISTVRILALITELAVPALNNIITYQDLQEMIKIDPITEMNNYDSFLGITKVEFQKSMRYKLDFSLLAIKIDGYEKLEELYGHDTRIEALKWMANKIKEMLRDVDIYGLGPKENQFVMALPITNLEGVLMVVERFKEIETSTKPRPKWFKHLKYFYGAASYHPSLDSFSALVKNLHDSLDLNKSPRYRKKLAAKTKIESEPHELV